MICTICGKTDCVHLRELRGSIINPNPQPIQENQYDYENVTEEKLSAMIDDLVKRMYVAARASHQPYLPLRDYLDRIEALRIVRRHKFPTYGTPEWKRQEEDLQRKFKNWTRTKLNADHPVTWETSYARRSNDITRRYCRTCRHRVELTGPEDGQLEWTHAPTSTDKRREDRAATPSTWGEEPLPPAQPAPFGYLFDHLAIPLNSRVATSPGEYKFPIDETRCHRCGYKIEPTNRLVGHKWKHSASIPPNATKEND